MKNTRGVQQEEVWAAADTLLAAGQRPTIERVRQHLGRGSPNTVAPMLETWFAGLGKRLGMGAGGAEEGAVPAAVVQAVAKMWDAALLAARKDVDATLAQERQALCDGRAAMSEREASLAQQEQAFAQRQDVVEQLLQAEREKTAVAEAGLKAIQQQMRAHEGTVAELRTALGNVQEQLRAARDRTDAQDRRHIEERTKWEERTAGNERRLLGEIERERQAAKDGVAAAVAANSRLQATRSDFENRILALGQRLHASEMELANARHVVALSEHRSTELSVQLQEQRSANAAVHEQLNQALAAMPRSAVNSKRKAMAGRETTK